MKGNFAWISLFLAERNQFYWDPRSMADHSPQVSCSKLHNSRYFKQPPDDGCAMMKKKRNNMCDKSTYWPSSPSFLSPLCKQSSTQPNILASSSQKMIHKINSRADILYNLGCPPQFRSWVQKKIVVLSQDNLVFIAFEFTGTSFSGLYHTISQIILRSNILRHHFYLPT